jgi:pyrimidine-nucleoside phosphorylase
MLPTEIIIRKRDGGKLTADEIAAFVSGYLRDEWTDYQAAALLMAIFCRGMDFEETAALTREMMHSGETYDLAEFGHTVDKHSTGGVGDKVSLILAPLAAACGVVVPMVSGRGLGHTGGTLDKLESIPGFRVRLETPEFLRVLRKLGVAMIGQSDKFVPADKRLYALRDVTGTVESIPLICASILSKKVASGAHALVMDVKTGTGAFMATGEQARALAEGLRGVAGALGRPVRALLTDMNQPLGRMVGNSLEVAESVDCLRGSGPADLRELTIEQAAEMIVLAGGEPSLDAARERATRALDSGAAWDKFRAMVTEQGGDVGVVDNPARLDVAPGRAEFAAPAAGWLDVRDCRAIGVAAGILGAGRVRTTDAVDPGVGLEMLARIGDKVDAGQPLVCVYHRDGRRLEECLARLAGALAVSAEPVAVPPLIHERIG